MRNERGEFARGMYRYHDHIGILAKRGRIFGKRKKPMHESKVENLSSERPQMQWADSRILCWTGWGAILVLAIWFRVLPIGSGFPYSDYMMRGTCFIKQSTRLTTAVSTFPGTGCPVSRHIVRVRLCSCMGQPITIFIVILFKKTCHKAQPGFLETEL